jgi:hypothetical protein
MRAHLGMARICRNTLQQLRDRYLPDSADFLEMAAAAEKHIRLAWPGESTPPATVAYTAASIYGYLSRIDRARAPEALTAVERAVDAGNNPANLKSATHTFGHLQTENRFTEAVGRPPVTPSTAFNVQADPLPE